ncbi:MAG: serine hydrolase domain-containing protein [Bacteroidota bacterium]
MRILSPNIAVALLSVLLFACHSDTQKVSAKENNKLGEIPAVTTPPVPLLYDTVGETQTRIIQQLDNYYRAQHRMGFNGGVLVGYDGKIVYERYFGLANRERKVPLSQTSSCQLASVSKTFTGAAILYLNEHKMLDINNPVQTYIKEFPYANITLKMLLAHRSGLSDYTHWVPNYNKDTRTPITNDAMIALMAKHKPGIEARPNTRFRYCNTNYALLATVVERVSGMNYRDFMDKYIFKPLGMEHTFVYNPAKQLPPDAAISYKYNWVREPDMFADGVYGDKGIYSTPQDMFRWDQSFYRKQLLSSDAIQLAYTPCSFEKPGVRNYGMGWRMLCFPNGAKVIYHNGWWHGNNTSFYRLEQDKMSIVILGNKYNKGIYRQAPMIYGIVKGCVAAPGFDTDE